MRLLHYILALLHASTHSGFGISPPFTLVFLMEADNRHAQAQYL